MNQELFDLMQQMYSPLIRDIINSNVRFYRTNQTIKWQFGYDDRVSIFACCNRQTNILTVNIKAVDSAYRENEPLQIEYLTLGICCRLMCSSSSVLSNWVKRFSEKSIKMLQFGTCKKVGGRRKKLYNSIR